MKIFRKIVAVVCLLLAAWFMLPLCIGMLHIGMVYPTVLLVGFAAALWFWEKICPLLMRHRLWTGVICGMLCLVLAMVLIPVGMIVHANANNAPPQDATVVLLGCQVVGETPSLILQDRCDKAIEYLNAHPKATCIATGGVGNRATISEAQAAFRYMTQRGVDPDRILLEEQATNTSENLRFTAAIVKNQGLCETVAIVSDDFHQWRGAYFAKVNGLTPYAIGCATRLSMAPGYWAREVAAVYKALLLGY